jgi:hypothetical protein
MPGRIAMLALRSVFVLAAAIAACSASALAAQRTLQPGQNPRAAGATPNIVVCTPYITLSYMNNAVIISCTDSNAPGTAYSFNVSENDRPTSNEVIAFVQPYIMTVKLAQVMPTGQGAMKTPIASFNSRIALYLENGKITGMSLTTVN